MTHPRFRTAAAVALAAFLLAVSAVCGAGALAQDTAQRSPAQHLRLDVAQLSPRTVTTVTEAIQITGTLTNTGDRRLTDLEARLEIGERQGTERQLNQALGNPAATDSAQSGFTPVTGSLAPGQSVPVTIKVPLKDSPRALRFARTGVYPLLVNVNATPEYGGPARMVALSMLMPVLGVPGQQPAEQPDRPTAVTMLWPIADTRPRVVDAQYGRPPVLADDQLAVDLAAGGRLDALVATARAAERDQRLSSGICFALDPDLLATVATMSRGYDVRGPVGLVPGAGAEAARRWLASLNQLVTNRCVIQLPFADSDIAALGKIRIGGGAPDNTLPGAAVANTALIRNLLPGAAPQPVLWPDGSLDQPAFTAIAAAGTQTVITDPATLRTNGAFAKVRIDGTPLQAQPFDSLLAKGMAGGGAGSGTDAGNGVTTPADQPNLAAQNGLAALAFRGGLGANPAGLDQRTLLFAPPRRWSLPAGELTALLDSVTEYTAAGLVNPVPLSQVLTAPPTGTATSSYPTRDAGADLPQDVTDTLSTVDTDAADVRRAMRVDMATQVNPDDLIVPIRSAILRATSTAWRVIPGGSRQAAENVRAQFDGLRGQVTIAQPQQRISLASGTSPLPVSVSNSLPVAITVRVSLNNNQGLRANSLADEFPIPPRSTINHRLEAEAMRAGRFSVEVSLRTPGGTPLGNTARFELTSSEYGAVTLIVTASAAGALLLLSGRRIYRRIRSRKPDRASQV